jgi:hypothetical protein
MEMQRLLISIKALSPSMYLFSFVLGFQGSLGIYQLTRLPVMLSLIAVTTGRPRDILLTLTSYLAGMISLFTTIGIIISIYPAFTIWFATQTMLVYMILGSLCLVFGFLIAGLSKIDDRRISALLEGRKMTILILSFISGALFVLMETPACPTCGSRLSQMAAMGLFLGHFRLAALCILYALGQCALIIIACLPLLFLYNSILGKNTAAREFFVLTNGFLLVFAAFLYLWTS